MNKTIATYLICFGLIAVITSTMYYFNSTVKWDYHSQKDQILIIVTNVSAISLCAILAYTAVVREDDSYLSK